MSPAIRLGITLSVASLTVVGAEAIARHLTTVEVDDWHVTRAANIVIASKNPANLPPHLDHPTLWLVGNSHTYSLPGLNKGDPLRSDPGVTLIDDLAEELSAINPRRKAVHYLRVANPNLLPIEMLCRMVWLLEHGHRPDVVVLGLTWRNVANDAEIRHDVGALFGDAAFVRALRSSVHDAGEDGVLGPIFDAEERRAAHELQLERQRSSADVLDELAAEQAGRVVRLVGASAELRASIYRSFAFGLTDLMGSRAAELTYDVIPEDLRVNRSALEALVRNLRAHGTDVVVYLAPQRSDLPLWMERAPEAAFLAQLSVFLSEQGATLIDARDAVPNEYWGWEHATPDRSHFTEPGHRLLARRLAEQGERAGAFARLDAE